MALQLMVNDTAGSAGSPPPAGFDHTWNFTSSTESWQTYSGGVLSQLSSYTPSSDSAASGVLKLTDGHPSVNPTMVFDLSTLSNYDNTQPLYYRIVFSIPSGSDVQNIDDIIYGNGGSSDSYVTETLTKDTWVTVEGELLNSGSNDDFFIDFYFNPTSSQGDSIYFDSIRVSHTDFR
jgi:hypothetical protein